MTSVLLTVFGAIWLGLGFCLAVEAEDLANEVTFRRDWTPPRRRWGLRLAGTLMGLSAVALIVFWLIRAVWK